MSEPDAGGFTEKLKAQRKKAKPNGHDHDATPLLNDYGNTQRLVAMHGETLRYCHEIRKWLIRSERWEPDTRGLATQLGIEAMFQFIKQTMGDKVLFKFAKDSLNEPSLRRMLLLAQSQLAIKAEQLDSHPWLLNMLNGTLELDTGILREHRREDYLTKLVHVNYNPAAICPRWLQFLEEILDPQLIGYLQRCLGYSLTGVTSEKAVFVLYGPPNAGKSTLLTTVRELIYEYAVVIQADTLMSRTHESPNQQADLADLRGARFAHTSECEASQRLSPSRLKQITQGMGQIKATRKYENPITFPETHKLWIDTNDKPQIKDVDDQAIFNRLHPIPFTKTITKEKIDPKLGEKLKAEAEGILAWMVAGTFAWQKQGLDKPELVSKATENWRSENDNVSQFLDDRCETGVYYSVPSSHLYSAYKQWCERSNEHAIRQNDFSPRIENKGFKKIPTERGKVFEGLRLRKQEYVDPADG